MADQTGAHFASVERVHFGRAKLFGIGQTGLFAGVGGVRIEDTLVVTADGAEPLTRFTKDVVA